MEDILIEEDVSDLKRSDRKNRYIDYFSRMVFEGMVLILLTLFLGYYILLGYFLALIIFLPLPIPRVPDHYEITPKHIVLNKDKQFRVKRSYRLETGSKHVSIYSMHREILRLYSEDPKKIAETLHEIMGKG